MNAQISPAWSGLLDDTADATDIHGSSARHSEARALVTDSVLVGELLGAFCVDDETLPLLRGFPRPVHVKLGGGAGQVAGPAGFAARTGLELAGLELALRDYDDLAGNVRRVVAAVDAARGEGVLGDDAPVYVEVPVDAPAVAWGNPSGGWLRAADEVGAAEFRLSLRLGGTHSDRFASAATLAAWMDAALDREVPMRMIGATSRAITHEVSCEDGAATAFGFANVLLATRRTFDGAGADVVAETLRETSAEVLAAWLDEEEFLASTRRWMTRWAGPSEAPSGMLTTAAADLRALGQLA